jgi:sigma-E factor negative regulatory protein RseA
MNTEEQLRLREQVSALADGQLHGVAFAATVEQLGADADGCASWHVYHLIGDVLRSPELGTCQHDREFVARLSTRLQAEPGIPRSVEGLQKSPELIANSDRNTLGSANKDWKSQAAANDGSYRWKMLAGLATIVAAAAIGWSGLGGHSGEAQLARQTTPEPVRVAGGPTESVESVSGGAVMIRDPHLDGLLAAHRQFGGSSAFQNPSGFLRNATFDAGAARGARAPGQ